MLTLLGRVDVTRSRVRTVLAAFILPLFCQACLGPSRFEAPVREEPDRFVRVEARYGDSYSEGQPRFNHPFRLGEKEWARILENVWVQHDAGALAFASSKEPSIPAFTADEITFLSQWLSKAFSHARSDEWVVFGLSRSQSPELTAITTGGWFVDGDRLHLTLANYRYAVTMATVRKQLWDDPLRSTGARYYSFAPGDYQSLAAVGGGPLAEVRGTAVPQLVIDYKNLLRPTAAATPAQKPLERPVEKPAQKPDAPPAALAPEPGLGGDLARKLRELKQLREEGLITEEEYRTKKKQLLDRY